MKLPFLKLTLMITALLAANCTPPSEEGQVTDDKYQPGFVPSPSKRRSIKTAEIPINVMPRTGSFSLSGGFSLASATNFAILLDGCLTGWTTTATAADPSLDVYIDDRECLAKLLEYEWEGKTYVPKSGSDFTTWLADDTAIFENDLDNTDTMEVRVVETLDNPVSGSEAIEYTFYELANGGSTQIPAEDVGDPHTLTVGGQSAPAFTVKSVTYHGTTAGGGGKFKFVMECNEDIDDPNCAENSMANITYKLVEDTYTADTPTIDEARTAFGTAGTSITIPTDVIPIGGSGTTHGGFTTVILDGPDEMHNHREMILFLRVDGGADGNVNNDSFTYFNIDVEILTYP